MEAADQNVPLNLNAFVLKKATDGMANAELDNVKPIKSGRVLIEVETKQQCKNLLKTTSSWAIYLLKFHHIELSIHQNLSSNARNWIKWKKMKSKKNFNHKESLLSKEYPYVTV